MGVDVDTLAEDVDTTNNTDEVDTATHVATCTHNSAECETPGSEHKTVATFTNMMGGDQDNYA